MTNERTDEQLEEIRLHKEKAKELWRVIKELCNDCPLEDKPMTKDDFSNEIEAVIVIPITATMHGLMKCGVANVLQVYGALEGTKNILIGPYKDLIREKEAENVLAI